MSSPAYIDAEELPFTPDELYGAARAFLPDVGARQMAEHLAACGPELVAERARRRAGWRRAGLVGADTMLLHGWTYPDALLPALAALSPEAAARVATLQARVEIAGRTAVPAARTEAGELGVVATELRRIGVDPEALGGLAGRGVTGSGFVRWLQTVPDGIGHTAFLQRLDAFPAAVGPDPPPSDAAAGQDASA